MDTVAQMTATDIQTILFPTISAFLPLFESKRDAIAQARKTFAYGTTERHQLDIYYPPNTGNKHPLLFYMYVYGGGFVSGDRTLRAPADVAYGNVGLYFAARGFITIVPDYRLVPHTTYPGPSEDLRDALAWAVAHAENLGPDADTATVFFLGHSAGGVHTLTLLLEPTVLAGVPDLRARIKGVVIASAPFHFEPQGHDLGENKPTILYYGSRERSSRTAGTPACCVGGGYFDSATDGVGDLRARPSMVQGRPR
ncbi:Alpha/Beta hydrolase protein [Mycena polygramma]|nr:Alpha/Beta hydrolase protein [Mycena polygramma]